MAFDPTSLEEETGTPRKFKINRIYKMRCSSASEQNFFRFDIAMNEPWRM